MIDDNKDEQFMKNQHIQKIQSKTIKAKSLEPMLSQDGLESNEHHNASAQQRSNQTLNVAEPVLKKEQKVPQKVEAKPTIKQEPKKSDAQKVEPKKAEPKQDQKAEQKQEPPKE